MRDRRHREMTEETKREERRDKERGATRDKRHETKRRET